MEGIAAVDTFVLAAALEEAEARSRARWRGIPRAAACSAGR